MYDDHDHDRIQKPLECMSFREKQLPCEAVKFFDSYFAKYGYDLTWFPFDVMDNQVIPRVRADDDVVVCATGTTFTNGREQNVRERFFCSVLSVTPCGIVTAVPSATLAYLPVSPQELVYFNVDAVLASRHGCYWEEDE